jgi:hypothetical protein
MARYKPNQQPNKQHSLRACDTIVNNQHIKHGVQRPLQTVDNGCHTDSWLTLL